MTTDTDAAAPEPQAVIAPLTGAAIFLVVVLNPGEDSADAVRDLCADLAGLIRAVGFRDLDGHLSCVTGFGAAVWDRLAGPGKPAGLHPFRELQARAAARRRHRRGRAVPHPGRADGPVLRTGHPDHGAAGRRRDRRVDEVHGFRYFDERDLIGFVDGTENPIGRGRRARGADRR